MRCIAANRSVLTALDQNTTLADYDPSNYTHVTDDIGSTDIIQFADGWYSYPDLNTFDSDLLIATLTLRVSNYSTMILYFEFPALANQTIKSSIAMECKSGKFDFTTSY